MQNDALPKASVLPRLDDQTPALLLEVRPPPPIGALLASIAEHVKDAILITEGGPLDGTGPRIIYANPSFCMRTGYSLSEVVGQTPRILQGPKTSRRELDRLRAALEKWQPIRVELLNYTKFGEPFDVELDIVPVANASGIHTHWVSVQRDITDRRNQEAVRLEALVNEMPHLVWRASYEGYWTWVSLQWMAYTGQSREGSLGSGGKDAVHPDDREVAVSAWAVAAKKCRLDVEFRLCRSSDGAFIWHHTRAVPVYGADQQITEWIGTTTNIQSLKTMHHRQQLLLAELQHRTRNQLAVVQAILKKTLSRSASLEDFESVYVGRLRAMSRVQSLLTRTQYEALDLRQLVEHELEAHGCDPGRDQTIEGPPVELVGPVIQALSLALHELATNATKYGALSQPGARLAVSWRLNGESDDRYLIFEWLESGVTMPAVRPASQQGFGTELIEVALPYQLGAKTILSFGDDGVGCSIMLKLPPSQAECRFG